MLIAASIWLIARLVSPPLPTSSVFSASDVASAGVSVTSRRSTPTSVLMPTWNDTTVDDPSSSLMPLKSVDFAIRSISDTRLENSSSIVSWSSVDVDPLAAWMDSSRRRIRMLLTSFSAPSHRPAPGRWLSWAFRAPPGRASGLANAAAPRSPARRRRPRPSLMRRPVDSRGCSCRLESIGDPRDVALRVDRRDVVLTLRPMLFLCYLNSPDFEFGGAVGAGSSSRTWMVGTVASGLEEPEPKTLAANADESGPFRPIRGRSARAAARSVEGRDVRRTVTRIRTDGRSGPGAGCVSGASLAMVRAASSRHRRPPRRNRVLFNSVATTRARDAPPMKVQLIHPPLFLNVHAMTALRPSLPLGLAYIASRPAPRRPRGLDPRRGRRGARADHAKYGQEAALRPRPDLTGDRRSSRPDRRRVRRDQHVDLSPGRSSWS